MKPTPTKNTNDHRLTTLETSHLRKLMPNPFQSLNFPSIISSHIDTQYTHSLTQSKPNKPYKLIKIFIL